MTSCVESLQSWFVCWLFEIFRDFVGLSGLYGLKYDGLITLVIAFVLVFLEIGRFCYTIHKLKVLTLEKHMPRLLDWKLLESC